MRTPTRLALALVFTLLASPHLLAQDDDTNDAVLKLAEPDFTVISLPTSLRLPKFGTAFRVTHRFARPLGQGDFGDLVDDLFGVDGGALIGLEFRFGLLPGGQIGIHRTSNDKTIQLFAEYGLTRQGEMPFEIAALGSVEGTDNLRDHHSPALGLIVSRLIGEEAAIHVQPMWVNNSNPLPSELTDHNDTFLIGIGSRVRIRPTVYLVGEFVPRVAGHDPGVHHGSFGIEKRAGGHMFQLNFSNSFATTPGQLARGGFDNDDWHLGFNITRKFF